MHIETKEEVFENLSRLRMLRLCEETVSKIEKECRKSSETKKVIKKDILEDSSRYRMKFDSIEFDELKLNKYKSTLEYLVGQLYVVHNNMAACAIGNGAVDYAKKRWTADPSILFSFYSLCVAAGVLNQLKVHEKTIYADFRTLDRKINITYPPIDPRFDDCVAEAALREWGIDLALFSSLAIPCKDYDALPNHLKRLGSIYMTKDVFG